MGLKDLLADMRENAASVFQTPVPEGPLIYRFMGWWLRVACWALAALLTLLVLGLAIFVFLLVMLTIGGGLRIGGGPAPSPELEEVLTVVVIGGVLLVAATLGAALFFGAGPSAVYSGWVDGRPVGLWGVRAIGLAMLLVGGVAALLRVSPLPLFLAALLVAATGGFVLVVSALPSIRGRFAPDAVPVA